MINVLVCECCTFLYWFRQMGWSFIWKRRWGYNTCLHYLNNYDLLDFTSPVAAQTPALVSFTNGIASLQLATVRAAALGVGGVVFLHCEDCGCLGNRWCSFAAGRGWHQGRGESLTGNIHRLRLLLQSAGGQTKHRNSYIIVTFLWLKRNVCHWQYKAQWEKLCDTC